jgi:hypothetical protein
MRLQALDTLQHNLAVATELAESLGDGGREGIFKAMVSITEYLSGQGVPRATLYPFELVAQAIVDADHGISTPAFKPDTSPGRPAISWTEYHPRAQRAVVVECCIRQKQQDGIKAFRSEGAKQAALLLRQAKWDEEPTGQKLLQLREEVTARPVGDPMRDAYEEMMSSDIAKQHPLAWAKTLLSHGWVNRVPKGPTDLS